MKKIILALALLPLFASAQYSTGVIAEETVPAGEGSFESSVKTMVVYTTKFPEGVRMLDEFVGTHKAVVSRSNKTETEYEVQFRINIKYLGAIDSIAAKLGYTTQNAYNTQNPESEIVSLQQKIRRLEATNKGLEEDLAESAEAEKANLRKQIRNNSNTINDYKFMLDDINNKTKGSNVCRVNFTLRDEVSTPGNSRIAFVNMPGFEYSYLFIENPKAGVSAKNYQGFGVKYMFTRGKSYFNLGVYKAVHNNLNDTLLIGDMFNIQFGQDFYPRHFGRGKRKYLNLYTGYQVGGFIATRNNDKSDGFVPAVNLNMGIELFKSKHILIDNKASYFLPLNDLNRNLRGISYSASLNFVF